jgi:hypothetical protein
VQTAVHDLDEMIISVLVSTLPLPLHPPPSSTMNRMPSDATMGPGTRLIPNQKLPAIPPHWIFERDGHPSRHTYFCWWPFFHFLHHLFCVIGLGHASLHDVWEMTYLDCPAEVWERWRDTVRARLEHTNIVVRFSAEHRQAFRGL